jgi:hypothetical protein
MIKSAFEDNGTQHKELKFFVLSAVMLIVVRLNVVMLSVVAPENKPLK